MISLRRLLPLAALLGVGLPAAAGDYAVDTGRSQLLVKVYKDESTVAAGLSHDHVMQASGWTGALSYDPATHACNLNISVPVGRLVVDDPQVRRTVGYNVELSADQREDVRKNMLSDTQLAASQHPNITFQSTSCDGTTMSGNLTVRGKSRPVSVKYKVEGSSFTINDRVQIRATDFGFEPYTALFGQLKNRNEMDLSIRIVATAQ